MEPSTPDAVAQFEGNFWWLARRAAKRLRDIDKSLIERLDDNAAVCPGLSDEALDAIRDQLTKAVNGVAAMFWHQRGLALVRATTREMIGVCNRCVRRLVELIDEVVEEAPEGTVPEPVLAFADHFRNEEGVESDT